MPTTCLIPYTHTVHWLQVPACLPFPGLVTHIHTPHTACPPSPAYPYTTFALYYIRLIYCTFCHLQFYALARILIAYVHLRARAGCYASFVLFDMRTRCARALYARSRRRVASFMRARLVYVRCCAFYTLPFAAHRAPPRAHALCRFLGSDANTITFVGSSTTALFCGSFYYVCVLQFGSRTAPRWFHPASARSRPLLRCSFIPTYHRIAAISLRSQFILPAVRYSSMPV